MHVLMLSLDPTMAKGGDGSNRERHRQYAAGVSRLTIITYSPPGFGETRELAPNCTVTPANSRSRVLFPLDAYRLGAKAARQHPPDLITTQDPFTTGLAGVWLRKRFGVPLLVQNHSYFFGNRAWLDESPLRNRVFHWVGQYVVRRADMYRTVNQQERQTYLANGGSPERVVTIPIAVGSQRFIEAAHPEKLAALRETLGLRPEHRVIIWVGYPGKVKRVPLLLEVMQQVVQQAANARLLLVGDMAQSGADLRAMAHQLGIADAVIMTGRVDHADIPAYYALASVYAHTSAYEGLPRVLSEAASAGLPLVGMDVVGVRDIIEDGRNGYLIPDMDAAAMAARLVELLNSPEQARVMGETGRQIVLERYNAASNAAAILNLWQEAVRLGLRA